MEKNKDLVDEIIDYLFVISPGFAFDVEKNNVDLSDIKREMRIEFGAREVYIKSQYHNDRKIESEKKMKQVLSAFNGKNATEIARKLGISRATVYRYLKQPGF